MKAKSRLKTGAHLVTSSRVISGGKIDSISTVSRLAKKGNWRNSSLITDWQASAVPVLKHITLYISRGVTLFVQTYRSQYKYIVPTLTFAAILVLIMTQVSPSVIVRGPVYGLYLWLLVPFFLCLYYFSIFWLFKWFRAMFVAASGTLLLFLRLQQVELSWLLVVIVLVFPLALEVIYRIMQLTTSNKRYFRNRKRS